MKSCVLLLVDDPETEPASSRLAAETSAETAAALRRAMVEDLLDMLRWSESEVIVCRAPEFDEERCRAWLGERTLWVQKGADRSARRANALRRALTIKHFDRALVLDSDIPQLDDETVRRALGGLEWNTCVLAPARGGFSLAGFDREGFLPDMFSHVPAEEPDALQKSLNVLEIYRRRPTLLDELPGIARLDDLRRLIGNPPKHMARSRTLALFRRLAAQ
ncbi:DUF2064 domain-containing protein [Desulfovibrio aminophilus]|nr:DUF2064 domain-containing protein [Desulfovibrio aminophilus]MCM0756862.1 DUF2064 domain-containing protein [Desulfovibrio aminophilus]